MGDLAAKDQGDLVGLPDGAVGIEESLEGIEGNAAMENEIIAIMCPPQICGVGVGTPGSVRRRAESRAHLRDESAYSDASHARSA
ncbi:MAG: hypothetical protein WB660_16760, partial [Candidatus Sulfotelmatobacter sp.]